MDNTLTQTGAELEILRAKDLHQRIIDSGARAADAYCEMCRNLKMMRDGGYYTHLGYESFEDYTVKALGFKTRQAYTYIQQFENLGEPFLQSNAKLGVTKLSLLVNIPAFEREEFIEKNDIAGMTVSEVKRLVAENDRKGEQLTLLSDQLADKDAVIVDKSKSLTAAEKTIRELTEQLEAERSKPVEAVPDNTKELHEQIAMLTSDKLEAENNVKFLREQAELQKVRADETFEKLLNANKKIKELEQREPIEKPVEDTEAREENKRLKEQQEEMTEEIKKLTEKVCELQEKPAASVEVPVADPKELFRIHYKNTVSSFNTMLEFMAAQTDKDFYISKCRALMAMLNEKLMMIGKEDVQNE